MPVLSIVIPAYNEERFIAKLLETVLAVPTEKLGFTKEVIVIDDGSTDSTAVAARRFPVKVLTQVPNQGKGKAVRRGIQESTGDYILIQDADLEYSPSDYLPMLEALRQGAQCVYGSRTLGQRRRQTGFTWFPGRHPEQRIGPWLAGQILTCWTGLLYGRWITDTLTAYKLYSGPLMRAMKIETTGFETDHEITAKLIRQGLRVVEVPVAYHPRSVQEGKKIRPVDGLLAVWTLWKYRFAAGKPAPAISRKIDSGPNGETKMRVLSIVVPAYNEEKFIAALIEAILKVDTESMGFSKEIIVVNDGSKDRTAEMVGTFPQVQLINQNPNQGRGAAMRRGAAAATGDYIMFQDADLEYDPADYPRMLAVLKDGDAVVYGNRLSGVIEEYGRGIFPGKHPKQSIAPWGAALVIRAFTSVLVGHWVPDMYSGLKLYPGPQLRQLKLETSGFELDHEMTVKLYRAGVRFGEAPISYKPRSVAEGKKIKPRDGVIALWTVLRYRLKSYADCLQPRVEGTHVGAQRERVFGDDSKD